MAHKGGKISTNELINISFIFTVESRLSGLGGTRVNSPDNRESG